MAKYTNEEYQNMKYRQVEAMYRKGLSIKEIMRCSGLTIILCSIPQIFLVFKCRAKMTCTYMQLINVFID